MPVLVAARIATGDGGTSASPAWVAVEADRIVALGTGDPPPGADVQGHDDAILCPGFLDVQVNGAGPIDFARATVDEIVTAVDLLAEGGCSACVPTVCTAPLDSYASMLDRLAAVHVRTSAAVGVHLEGPFLGGAPGAHPTDLLRRVDLEWLLDCCDRHPGLIRIVTLAPEADAGFSAIRALSERGVVVALGHSTATFAQARAAADAGARMVTHLFNGMGPLHHREPGLAGAALDDRRLVPSLIADLVHVHPAALRLALAARPDAVLVTDRVGGDLHVRDGAARLADGTLAGSVVTMVESVQLLAASGISIGQAIRTGTGNPARVLGLDDRGRVAPGYRADLCWLDAGDLSLRGRWPARDRRDS